jgi:uncharacterized repeat protein (TIGR01451 family)
MGAGVLWSVSGKSPVKSHHKSPEAAPQHKTPAQDRITTAEAAPDATSPAPTKAAPAFLPAMLKAQRLAVAAKLPLSFEPNQGQTDARAAYVARGAGYGLFLTPTEAVLSLGAATQNSASANAAIHMQIEGASPEMKIAASDPLPGRSNYFRGNDRSHWVRNVPTFSRVRYSGVYPGVDLVFYGNQGQLEYDFAVRSGADLGQIRLNLSGVEKVSLSEDGSLSLKTSGHEIRWNKPTIYQEVDGRRRPVTGGFELLAQNRVGFAVGAYDHSRELVIDPVLAYATYFGGAGDEVNPQVAVDANSNVYLAGTTSSATLFPTEPCGGTTPPQPLCPMLSGTTDVFVSKLDPVGSAVIYTTYLNGLSIPGPTPLTPYGPASGADSSAGLSVDSQGNAYIAGTTTSSDFPVTPNAFQSAPVTAQAHVFLSKLDTTGGALLYSTYLSGSNTDTAIAVAADNLGNAFILGTTQSVATTDFPNTGSFQQQANGATDLYFVSKFDTTQTVGSQTLKFFSYLGGGTNATTDPATPAAGVVCPQLPCGGIVLDTTGNAYVALGTTFTNMPVANAYQSSLHGALGKSDAYLAKIAANGSGILYATYLGGGDNDAATAISIDSSGNAYLTGYTTSTDFPGTNKFFPTFTGTQDAFAAKLNNPTTGPLALTFSTYLGGTGVSTGFGISADSTQSVFVVGSTNSPNFPTPGGTVAANGTDAFLAKFSTTAAALSQFVSSELRGGSGTDRATSVVQNSNGALLVAGETNSTDFPVQSSVALKPPLQTLLNGTGSGSNRDVFLANYGPSTDLGLSITASPNPVAIGNAVTFTYKVQNNGPDASSGAVLIVPIPLASALGGTLGAFSTASSYSCAATGTTPNQNETCTFGTIASGSSASVTVSITPAVFTTGPNSGNPPGSVGMNGHVAPGNTAVDTNPVNDNPPQTNATVEYFTSSVLPSSVAVTAGGTAQYTVTVKPNSSAGFPASITLSCVNPTTPVALAGTTCTFTPSSFSTIPSSSGSVTSVLKITTTAPTQTASVRSIPTFWYALWLPICSVALFGTGSSRRRRWMSGAALVLLLGTIAWLPACGSKSTAATTTGTQRGTYSIVVSAKSGSYTYPPTTSPGTISLIVN